MSAPSCSARGAIAIASLLLSACSKSEPPAPAAAIADAAPAPAASAPPAPAAPSAWSGSYTATPGTLFVPDGGEWSGVKFRGEDASVGLGAGTLTFTVDPKSGRADGTTDGALGDLVVTGLLDGTTFSARLSPKDPSAGFTGTALGTREGDAIHGTMHLSYPTGNVIREATFSLAPAKK